MMQEYDIIDIDMICMLCTVRGSCPYSNQEKPVNSEDGIIHYSKANMHGI